VLDRCFFTAITGRDQGGFFVTAPYLEGRTVSVLYGSWPVGDVQSAVAHEIAHVWLGHPEADFGNEAETHEDEAAAQVRERGFTGLGSLPYGERP
jgi:hypothetical protein